EIVEHGGLVPGGIVPLRDTIFTWQSLTSVGVELSLVAAIAWAYVPPDARARTATSLGVVLEPLRARTASAEGEETPSRSGGTPAERLERSSALGLVIFSLGLAYLAVYVGKAADRLAAINVNTINFAMLMLGVALHRTPARLMHAVRAATPATWGVILQFPF